ncbi:PPOX class F420-dependent oxidoreductase [Streptomyces sp. NPDC021093]|uniref:PPOX class F420-dependent oxidoreductase n=1 Tax=Streptomyces sp. NPDC021093 TaxID=3365112 RepID=UPI003794E4E8
MDTSASAPRPEPHPAPRLSAGLKQHLDTSPAFGTVATLLPDGRPHLTVVWVTRDGDDLLFSTTVERLQGKNLSRDPRVTVLVTAPDDPYAYAEIRGTATLTPDPDHSLANTLSLAHTGRPFAEVNPSSAASDFVTVRVTPTRVTGRL